MAQDQGLQAGEFQISFTKKASAGTTFRRPGSESMEKILEYFVRNKLLINLIVITIFIFGMASLLNIRREVFPATDMDTMIITVIYPGASAVDVELNVVIPIETELGKIAGIKEHSSFAIENGATLYAHLDYDLENKQAVKDEIHRNITLGNIPDIPGEVEDITIIEVNPKRMAVYTLSLTTAGTGAAQEKALNTFARRLEDDLLKIKGVGEIRKRGYRDREIVVAVHPAKMREYYISLNDVVKSIQARNVRATGGTLQSLQKEQTIVTIGQFEHPLEVKEVIIRSSFEQKRVRIKDIATVRDGFKKENVRVKVNGKKAIVFQVVKKENADVVKTSKNVRAFLQKLKPRVAGRFEITTLEDRSLSVTSLLDVVVNNALIGFILVFVVLFLFLDLKTSFWTAVGIPISLLMVIIYMNLADISLNLMSLGAIIVVLGMLVDHGIVIAENIFEQKQTGQDPVQASVLGVKKVIAPVTVTILTTIAAFIPLLYIKGMMGKFVQVFPLIVTATLLASLFAAVIILPNHLVGKHEKATGKKQRPDWFQPLAEAYEKWLGGMLRFRYLVITAFVVIFALTLMISRGTINHYVNMWDDSSEAIYVNLEAPESYGLDKTEEITGEVEDILREHLSDQETFSLQTHIGHHTVRMMNSKGNHENWSQVHITLVPRGERNRTAAEIISELRQAVNIRRLKKFKKIVIEEHIMGPPTGEAVNVKIKGNNMQSVRAAMQKVEELLRQIPGVKDIDNDLKLGKEELKVRLNYERLAQYGLTVAAVAQTIRTAYEGTVATYLQSAEEKIDFRVQVDEVYQRDRRFLEELKIPNAAGKLITLSQIATIIPREGASVINHHKGNRVATVTADIDEKITTSSQVARKIKQRFAKVAGDFPGTYLGIGGEAKETKESLGGLIMAFLIALVMIYFILLLLFGSLSQPLLVVVAVPFGLIGALLSFTAHGIPLSFMGLVGMIGLSGVVVNDSVIMVNFINEIFRTRKSPGDLRSIIKIVSQGARQRLRPVILTTLTTVAALLPTVYGIGGNAKSLVPVVMAMAYGLVFATTVTLLLVPALYLVNGDMQKLFKKTAGEHRTA